MIQSCVLNAVISFSSNGSLGLLLDSRRSLKSFLLYVAWLKRGRNSNLFFPFIKNWKNLPELRPQFLFFKAQFSSYRPERGTCFPITIG